MTKGNVIELGARLEGEGLQDDIKINLLYEVEGVTDDQMKQIYEKTDMSAMDKVKAICGIGSLRFSDFVDKGFAERVTLIDSHMGEILAELVLDYYLNDVTDLKRLVGRLERKNPFGFTRDGIYEYKIKRLLYAAALGGFDTEEKSGETEEKADGVFIGLKSSSKLKAFMYGTEESVELAERIFETACFVGMSTFLNEQDVVFTFAESIVEIVQHAKKGKENDLLWEGVRIITDRYYGGSITYIIPPSEKEYRRTEDIRTLTNVIAPDFSIQDDNGNEVFTGMGEEYPVIAVSDRGTGIYTRPLVEILCDKYYTDDLIKRYDSEGRSLLAHTVWLAVRKMLPRSSIYDWAGHRCPDDMEVLFMTNKANSPFGWDNSTGLEQMCVSTCRNVLGEGH